MKPDLGAVAVVKKNVSRNLSLATLKEARFHISLVSPTFKIRIVAFQRTVIRLVRLDLGHRIIEETDATQFTETVLRFPDLLRTGKVESRHRELKLVQSKNDIEAPQVTLIAKPEQLP